MSEKINRSIIKFLTNSANTFELDVLNNWLKDASNEKLFKEYVKTHYAITIGMSDTNYEDIKKRLQEEIKADKIFYHKKSVKTFFKYAAVGILFISLGYFLTNLGRNLQKDEPFVSNEEMITLELNDGEIIVLEEQDNERKLQLGNKFIGIQRNGRLSYSGDKIDDEKVSYNTINVPYGKRFDIILSDGTVVYLNSGSSLKYATKFLTNQTRNVILKGEAFFDVAHDKTRPFVVETEELNVKVLGTKFNLSNYQEDSSTDVVLTGGSVNISYKNIESEVKGITLIPGMKGSLNKDDKSISTQKVNTTLYTSWLDNNLVFRDASFNYIIKKLERKYNVIIINNNKNLLNETFNATIECDKENIIDVFEYFKIIHHIEYRVYENKIIIE